MKNNIILVLLVVLIGVLSGLGLLFGVSNAVQVAVAPLVEKAGQVVGKQQDIDRKMGVLNDRLMAMEKRLDVPPPPQQNPPQPPQEDLNKVYDIPVGNSIVVGKKDAPVTIVQFTDLQCPFCSRFYAPVKEALKAYPDQVRLIIKDFPLSFHPHARPAAKVALAAAEQGKYIEMIELLLANGADVSESKVKEYAQTLGIDYSKLTADLIAKETQYEQQITDDINLGSQVDVRGTPTFYINGKKTMARDFNGFKSEIDSILGEK